MIFLRGSISLFLTLVCLSSALRGSGFYDEAKRRAEQGDPKAQEILSYMYETGKGVPRDPAQAKRWSEQAAKQRRSGSRMTPTRPSSVSVDYPTRMRPRRPGTDTSQGQSLRMNPRRPSRSAQIPVMRAEPRRPGGKMIEDVARYGFHRSGKTAVDGFAQARLRRTEFGSLEGGVRKYQRAKRWHRKLSAGSKILVRPVKFVFRQSGRALSKVVRKVSLGGLALY